MENIKLPTPKHRKEIVFRRHVKQWPNSVSEAVGPWAQLYVMGLPFSHRIADPSLEDIARFIWKKVDEVRELSGSRAFPERAFQVEMGRNRLTAKSYGRPIFSILETIKTPKYVC